jgi:4-hydroxy-tetrahydrodipicolinate reductase
VKIRLVLSGYSGKMGQEILALADKDKEVTATTAWSPRFQVKSTDVVVDFSSPAGFRKSLAFAVKTQRPFVSGTTGLSAKDFVSLKKAARKIPVLWASNMSLGIHLLLDLLPTFTRVKELFDFQIVEIHHRRKVDAPSGTAKTLQSQLVEAVDRTVSEPVSIRGGGVFGVHKVLALGEEEVLTIEHQALNRTVFARGALLAAKFCARRRKGLYSMSDVLRG